MNIIFLSRILSQSMTAKQFKQALIASGQDFDKQQVQDALNYWRSSESGFKKTQLSNYITDWKKFVNDALLDKKNQQNLKKSKKDFQICYSCQDYDVVLVKSPQANQWLANNYLVTKENKSSFTPPNWCVSSSRAVQWWNSYKLNSGLPLAYIIFSKHDVNVRYQIVFKAHLFKRFIDGEVKLYDALCQCRDSHQKYDDAFDEQAQYTDQQYENKISKAAFVDLFKDIKNLSISKLSSIIKKHNGN